MSVIVRICLVIGDALLGWSLHLVPDAALAVLSLATSAVLILLRRATTDQDRLGRAAADRRRLKELIRQARHGGDGPALSRYRATLGRVSGIRLAAEMRPLLISVLPIAVLTTWAAWRLAYHPPRAGEPIGLLVQAPLSAVGTPVHLVPADGLLSDRWIRTVQPFAGAGPPHGTARWTLRAASRPEPYRLLWRIRREQYEHPLLVGGKTYLPPVVEHGSAVVSTVELEPVRLFGIVPRFSATWLPPWLIGYLLLTIVLTAVGRIALRIR